MDKTVIVTGGAKSIGYELAKTFAELGANVYVFYNKTPFNGDFAKGIKVDLTDEAAVNAVVKKVFAEARRIDLLINNAGVGQRKLLIDCDASDFDYVINGNLRTAINATKAVIPHMLRAGGGNIINISSVWGTVGGANETLYSAAKGALEAFTKAVAKEYASAKIRINSLALGAVNGSTMMQGFTEKELQEIPQITMQEVTSAAVFLQQNNGINGQTIVIDRGLAL